MTEFMSDDILNQIRFSDSLEGRLLYDDQDFFDRTILEGKRPYRYFWKDDNNVFAPLPDPLAQIERTSLPIIKKAICAKVAIRSQVVVCNGLRNEDRRRQSKGAAKTQ